MPSQQLFSWYMITFYFEGFGVYYEEEGTIKLINFTIISSDLNQDGKVAVKGFRILRDQAFFRILDEKVSDYCVWCDCGSHFRNCEFVGYCLELAAENKHGKFKF
jgi:hypothetical protein